MFWIKLYGGLVQPYLYRQKFLLADYDLLMFLRHLSSTSHYTITSGGRVKRVQSMIYGRFLTILS